MSRKTGHWNTSTGRENVWKFGKVTAAAGTYQNHAIQMEMTTADDLLNHVIDMEKEQAEKEKCAAEDGI